MLPERRSNESESMSPFFQPTFASRLDSNNFTSIHYSHLVLTSPLPRTSLGLLSVLLNMREANPSSQIDTDKLAQLAGFSNGNSANASWLVIKKKLMNGATMDAASTTNTPKKGKAKAAANADADDDDEATPTKAAPKKRGKAIKTEPTDAEGGDADTEITPGAESPKKARAKKATAASKTEVNGDGANDTAATEATTLTPKRKRGPNKPKDPNATPTKRAKKGANAATKTNNNDDAANAQLNADEPNEGESMFGGDANIKTENAEDGEEEGDDRPFDAEEQKLFNTEDQVA